MRRRRKLPSNLSAGILGAEAATWLAVSPSLLPRPWWVTAANVAVCQGVGHAVGTSIDFVGRALIDASGSPKSLRLQRDFRPAVHIAMASTTVLTIAAALWRQDEQARLINAPEKRGSRDALAGLLSGTLGYGAILLIAEGSQASIDRFNHELRRWLPPFISWPLASLGFGAVVYLASDRVIVRSLLNQAARKARALDEAVFPGSSQPAEPERSGSPDSLESWSVVGSQGRALLSGGARAADIARLTPVKDAREPIRVFIGLDEGRTFQDQVELALAEMDRTGAWDRRAIVMMTSAGTGWLTDWSVGAFEFLTGGDCATVALQYSYLPSALSYVADHDSPVESSRLLIDAIIQRLGTLDCPPRFYVSGESLGAYGIADSFGSADDLLSRVDGAVFSGTPRFTHMLRSLTEARDHGSPERLPIVHAGQHVRFCATPDHLEHDFSGTPYAQPWRHPRVVFAQHASDPIVFWHPELFVRRPDWLTEPGARGQSAPAAQHVDVFQYMRWAPFITGWQVGLDQLTCLDVPGGHGHQYHVEMLWYWKAVLGDTAAFELSEAAADAIEEWLYQDHIER
ncbi:hypothetical protein FHE74_10225 [Corynebacterium tapiri]|uniref:Alpha/beta-hydrolase family protein n=2 Tax=Corynebacterium tapiri TaxID=1448266 RepID=A0A5C4U160_9CORY|nr:hypothetical protein FHE74_10225 [Corynebacterium tapiri]